MIGYAVVLQILVMTCRVDTESSSFSSSSSTSYEYYDESDDCNRSTTTTKDPLKYVVDNNKEMVDFLIDVGDLKTQEAKAAMYAVDRKHYCKKLPYFGYQMDIGYGASIETTLMVAFVLESFYMHINKGAKVLDIGCGSGYLTMCFANMTGPTGQVIAIDHIPELVRQANRSAWKDNPHVMRSGYVKFIVGDGRLGYPQLGLFDAIYIGASTGKVPRPLMKQLKPGGRMLVPVNIMKRENATRQVMMVVDNIAGFMVSNPTNVKHFATYYEALTHKHHQWPVPKYEKYIKLRANHDLDDGFEKFFEEYTKNNTLSGEPSLPSDFSSEISYDSTSSEYYTSSAL